MKEIEGVKRDFVETIYDAKTIKKLLLNLLDSATTEIILYSQLREFFIMLKN